LRKSKFDNGSAYTEKPGRLRGGDILHVLNRTGDSLRGFNDQTWPANLCPKATVWRLFDQLKPVVFADSTRWNQQIAGS
jgi:hypothetical protein